jgi:hypothetical protein
MLPPKFDKLTFVGKEVKVARSHDPDPGSD